VKNNLKTQAQSEDEEEEERLRSEQGRARMDRHHNQAKSGGECESEKNKECVLYNKLPKSVNTCVVVVFGALSLLRAKKVER
jgi:hypothetical protein